jgi:hypothetical protein
MASNCHYCHSLGHAIGQQCVPIIRSIRNFDCGKIEWEIKSSAAANVSATHDFAKNRVFGANV